jgi:phage anti-repressor protein
MLEVLFPASSELFSVDVKNLHLWLEVETRVNDWFTRRVKYFGFTQGVDFVLLKNEHNDIEDLRCTTNMAKELGMLERSISEARYASHNVVTSG